MLQQWTLVVCMQLGDMFAQQLQKPSVWRSKIRVLLRPVLHYAILPASCCSHHC
jgi:hypothetical protein